VKSVDKYIEGMGQSQNTLCFVTVPYLQYIFCQHSGDEHVKDCRQVFYPSGNISVI